MSRCPLKVEAKCSLLARLYCRQPLRRRCRYPTDRFWHSCPYVKRLDACSMKPKLGSIVIFGKPESPFYYSQVSFLKEWGKLFRSYLNAKEKDSLFVSEKKKDQAEAEAEFPLVLSRFLIRRTDSSQKLKMSWVLLLSCHRNYLQPKDTDVVAPTRSLRSTNMSTRSPITSTAHEDISISGSQLPAGERLR